MNDAQKYARVFYLTEFLYHFSRSVFHAVYTVFLVGVGLKIAEVNDLRIAFFVTIVLFEVPTGVFADRFGRKVSMLASAALLFAGYLVYYSTHSYEAFFVAVFCTGVGFTLYSGSLEAWIVDTLDHLGSRIDLGVVFAKGNYFKRVGMLVGGTAGSVVAVFDMNGIWLVGMVGMGLLIVVTALYLRELVPPKGAGKRTRWGEIWTRLTHRNILLLFGMSFVLFVYNQPNFLYWQVYFKAWFDKAEFVASAAQFQWMGRPVETAFALLGLVFLINNFLSMQGSALLKRMYQGEARPRRERRWFLTSIVMQGVGYVGLYYAHTLATACLAYAAVCFFSGIFDPIFRKHLNLHIENDVRATMLSLNALFSRVGSIISLLTLGKVAALHGVDLSYLYGGVVFVILMVPLAWVYLRQPKVAAT